MIGISFTFRFWILFRCCSLAIYILFCTLLNDFLLRRSLECKVKCAASELSEPMNLNWFTNGAKSIRGQNEIKRNET